MRDIVAVIVGASVFCCVFAAVALTKLGDPPERTPPRYLTIGMACTTEENAPYPHIWVEKRDFHGGLDTQNDALEAGLVFLASMEKS